MVTKKKKTAPVKDVSKNTPAPAETQTAETPKPEAPAAPFEGGIEKQLPKDELKVDVIDSNKELQPDKVFVSDKDLPKVDEVAINKDLMTQETSPYQQDTEVAEKEAPKKNTKKQDWVADPSLLKKIDGVKDTLTGPLYTGEPK